MSNDNSDTMRIASFDIGKKNFAFCVEQFSRKDLLNIPLKPTPKVFTQDYTESLNNICSNGEILLLDNVDLTKGVKSTKQLDPIIYRNMIQLLDQHADLLSTCDIIVIEQQMSFRNKQNVMALKMAQHCHSYFLIRYESKTVYEIPAYYKTKIFTDSKLSDYARKKWAVGKALEILHNREDVHHFNLISARKKKDDLSDVIVQAQAFKYLYGRKGGVL